ncbi:MAG: DUF3866 family protein [Syntrophomonas sp.]
MIEIKRGTLIKELFARDGIKGYLVEVDNQQEKCIVYPDMIGEVNPGDEVVLNTSAVSLNLGTGGYHFVVASLNTRGQSLTPGGHIMKLRYTPVQLKVLSVEEEDSPHREQMLQADSLDNIPVLVGTLHSMLAPLCQVLKTRGLKVAYVMTDGAALPISFSRTVDWLKKNNLLQGTVTVGNAFGGDLEAVNVYSGMLAARTVLQADVIIVTMGPGIVGTGTKWGFTGVEQGEILNAAETLNGIPVAIPRIGFTDQRPRHQGISHHTITVLSRICRVKAIVPLPLLEEKKMSVVMEQIENAGLFNRYGFCVEDSQQFIELYRNCELKLTTMGRGVDEEKDFYLTLGAAALTAIKLYNGDRPGYISMV